MVNVHVKMIVPGNLKEKRSDFLVSHSKSKENKDFIIFLRKKTKESTKNLHRRTKDDSKKLG